MANRTVGIRTDSQSSTSFPNGSGSGIAISRGNTSNSDVEVYDLTGTLLGSKTQGDFDGPTFGIDQGSEFFSPEISWNPSNSGTLSCTATAFADACNGVGSFAVDTSGDLKVGISSGPPFTCYISYVEFDCRGVAIATGAPHSAKSFNGVGANAYYNCRIQVDTVSVTGGGYYGFPHDYGSPLGGNIHDQWVTLDASPRNASQVQPLGSTMNLPLFTGVGSVLVPYFFAPYGNVVRYVFVPPAATSGFMATLSRSAGMKIKFTINRYTYQEVNQWPAGGFIVKAEQ